MKKLAKDKSLLGVVRNYRKKELTPIAVLMKMSTGKCGIVKSIKGIEGVPAIVNLNNFAEKLPLELRQELFKTVFAFFSIGATHGIFTGFEGAFNTSKNPKETRLDQYSAYLTQRIQEYENAQITKRGKK
ncbi:MAG: hypothetical protein WCK10_02460 [Candidatus Staskawiczbacteria bacterium]